MYYVGHLLTLGIKPVGTLSSELDNPFIKDKVKGIEDIGSTPSLEKVVDLDPDLIIASDKESYDKLKKIAPTVLIEYGKHNVVDEMKMLGKILGKEKQSDQWLADFNAKGQKAKDDLKGVVGPNDTVSIIEIWSNKIYVYGNKWGRGGYNLYNVLGFKPPQLVKENVIDNKPYMEVSLETLPKVAGDYIFLSVYSADGGDKRADEIKKSDIWKSLPAVKKGHVYNINLDQFFYFDPISLEKQLEIQEKLLLGK
nr:ABC transporter substrate-binding protein [Pullulanibacillus pueri]